ncbi:MAG: FHA domain-containing protein [Phycisphaerales bacterium]|nr:FHA domain-containing protein [Phycisphaerales bacterium]
MAILICCPCGLPLDCENIDLVIDAACPRCKRNLDLEFEDESGARRRAVLTILEGPIWKGEQFVMPIGQQLTLGSGTDGWLSLEGEDLEEKHCRLRVSTSGYCVVEDLDTASGTWIDNARIVKGKLFPTQSVRIGEFRFRLDFRSTLGQDQPAVAISDVGAVAIAPDQTFERLRHVTSPLGKLIQRRFVYARSALSAFAWITAAYHCVHLRYVAEPNWPGYWAVIASAIIVTILLATTRLVALVHRYAKYAGIASLVLLSIVDLAAWRLHGAAIPPLVLAAAVSLAITRTPGPAGARGAGMLVVGAVTTMAVMTLNIVLPLLPV